MGGVYVLRQGGLDEFRIVRTSQALLPLIDRLSEKTAGRLEEFSTVKTADDVACETYLHQSLRPKRKLDWTGFEFYALSSAEMSVAVMDAQWFVSELVAASQAAEQLEKIEPDPGLPAVEPSSQDLATYSRLLRVRDAQDHLKAQRELCESKLKLSMGNATAIKGIATWKGSWRNSLNIEALRGAEPALFENLIQRFEKKSYTRYFKLHRPM
jgi:hypothetical protein